MSDGVRQVLRAQQAFEYLAEAVRQGMLRLKIPLCRYFHGAETLKETLDSAAPVPVKGIIQ